MSGPNDRAALHARCREEGLTLMADVFDVILDRGEVTVGQITRWLDGPDRDAMTAYEGFIVKGIDRLSDAIQGTGA